VPTLLVQQESSHLSIPTIEIKSFVNGCGESWCHCDAPLSSSNFLLPSPQQSIVLNKTSRITPHLPPNLEISLSVFAPGSVPKGIWTGSKEGFDNYTWSYLSVFLLLCSSSGSLSFTATATATAVFFGVHLVVTVAHRRVCCLALQLQSMMKHNSSHDADGKLSTPLPFYITYTQGSEGSLFLMFLQGAFEATVCPCRSGKAVMRRTVVDELGNHNDVLLGGDSLLSCPLHVPLHVLVGVSQEWERGHWRSCWCWIHDLLTCLSHQELACWREWFQCGDALINLVLEELIPLQE